MEEVVSQCQYHENCSLIFKCSLCNCLYCSKCCEVNEYICIMDKMNKCQIVDYYVINKVPNVFLFGEYHDWPPRKNYLLNIALNIINWEGEVIFR